MPDAKAWRDIKVLELSDNEAFVEIVYAHKNCDPHAYPVGKQEWRSLTDFGGENGWQLRASSCGECRENVAALNDYLCLDCRVNSSAG